MVVRCKGARLLRRGVAACALLFSLGAARAQTQESQPVMAGMGRMLQGTVTAVSGDKLTVKMERGEVFQVSVSANTRVTKGRDPVKLADVKVGDGVGAVGEVDQANKTVHAMFLVIIDAEQVKKARENLGKTYIAGKVTAMNELTLTVLRPDGVSQAITVDEGTSFRRGGGRGMARMGEGSAQTGVPAGESITLADIKVGDNVFGVGSQKNGSFVPTELAVSAPGQGGGRRRHADGSAAGMPGTEPKQ